MNGVDRNTDHDLYIATGKTCQYYGMALCKCKQDFFCIWPCSPSQSWTASTSWCLLDITSFIDITSMTSMCQHRNWGSLVPKHGTETAMTLCDSGVFLLTTPCHISWNRRQKKNPCIYIYISIIHDRYYKCNWKSNGDLPSGTACPTPFKGGRRHPGASPFY